jgi:transcriptional regulator with XRE-family HTH domain
MALKLMSEPSADQKALVKQILKLARPADLGRRLRFARDKLGLSLKGASPEIGVSAQAIQHWESGNSVPDYERLVAAAQVYKEDPVWLMLGVRVSAIDAERTKADYNFPEVSGRGRPKLNREELGASFSPKLRGHRIPVYLSLNLLLQSLKQSGLDLEQQGQVPHDFVVPGFDVPEDAFGFDVADKRNAPDHLVGDTIIISPNTKPMPGSMVLAICNHELVFGLMRSSSGSVVIGAINPVFGDEQLSAPSSSSKKLQHMIIGVMVGFIRQTR